VSEKERFEAWAKAEGLSLKDFYVGTPDDPAYNEYTTFLAWEAWQAAQAAPVEPCCGDYFNCQRPCTPRGRELEKREHTTPPAEPTPETGLAIIEAMHAQGFHDANAEDALFVYRAVIGSAK